jgi:ABC-2 type transport system ATP-binding protein
MIQVRGLTKVFPSGTKAVDGLDLSVPQGKIFGLLGPNGAGKTTTIRALSTLCGFDSGEVIVAGHDVDREPEKVRRAIGVVAQNTGIDYFLTGRENLELQGHLYRMKKSDIKARVAELTKYFELEESLERQVATYSGGMRRRLDIATALIHHPRLVFLDEPTLGLDIKSRKILWSYIEKLNKEMGITILLTTHYLEEADKLAHCVAIISGGRIRAVGTPDELKSRIAGDALTLHLEQQDWAARQFVHALMQTDYVRDSLWEGNKLHLYITNGAESVPKITELAGKYSVHILTLSLSHPNLDDVFLKYTGTSMEDTGEDNGDEWWKQWAGKGGGKWQAQWKSAQEGNEDVGDRHGVEQADQERPPGHQTSSSSTEQSSAGWPQQKWTQEEMEQWYTRHNGGDVGDASSPPFSPAAKVPDDADQHLPQWSAEEAARWQGSPHEATEETAKAEERTDESSNKGDRQTWPSDDDDNAWPDQKKLWSDPHKK